MMTTVLNLRLTKNDDNENNSHSPDSLPPVTSSQKCCYFGDGLFGSVRAVAAVGQPGHHACMAVKTAHTRSPKAWLEEEMKEYPGGTWIVLEGRMESEVVDLICIGYKYYTKN